MFVDIKLWFKVAAANSTVNEQNLSTCKYWTLETIIEWGKEVKRPGLVKKKWSSKNLCSKTERGPHLGGLPVSCGISHHQRSTRPDQSFTACYLLIPKNIFSLAWFRFIDDPTTLVSVSQWVGRVKLLHLRSLQAFVILLAGQCLCARLPRINPFKRIIMQLFHSYVPDINLSHLKAAQTLWHLKKMEKQTKKGKFVSLVSQNNFWSPGRTQNKGREFCKRLTLLGS